VLDFHNDECAACRHGGDLLCCDTCASAYHLGCVWPKLATVPEGVWSCAECERNPKMQVC
jgi:hypothetical protein